MTQRKVIKNVTDMEIDEISVVDRGGNQFADVLIAKRATEEDDVPEDIELFDEHGEPVSSLEDGQVVYDAEGNAYEFEADDEAEGLEIVMDASDEDDVEESGEDLDAELAELTEEELADVEKGFANPFKILSTKVQGYMPKAKQLGASALASKPVQSTVGAAKTAGNAATKTPGRALATGAVAGTAGGAGAVSAFGNKDGIRKSFSEEVMEELSKAMTDEDRDAVLSKALGQVEAALEAQAEAFEIAKSERELRLTNEYISKAAEYNLPVDPAELGPVLYRMVETMSHEDCAVIAKCLDAASTALFEEVGYIGGGDNVDPLEQVNALAAESLSKHEDRTNAFLSVMDEHPGAYDEYLAARRGY